MTHLDRDSRRGSAWLAVIVGAYTTINAGGDALFGTGRAFRLFKAAFVIVGLVVVVMGCRELLRSKTT